MSIFTNIPSIKFNLNNKAKTYAIGLLVYSSPDVTTQTDPKWNSRWDYLFGACMIYKQFKKNTWFQEKCDIIVLTPYNTDQMIINFINNNFDGYATYEKSLFMEHPFNYVKRYNGVFNKLYFWNKQVFNYKRILIMDTDIFIINPIGYIQLFEKINGIAGMYEHNYINKNNINLQKLGCHIPEKYTNYIWSDGKSYYNMISASIISFEPDTSIFKIMIEDIYNGWDKVVEKYNSFKGKKGKTFFPEQEYLTGFFSGKWKNLPLGTFRTTTRTKYHYGSFPEKYWNLLNKIEKNILYACIDFFNQNYDAKLLFPNIYSNISKYSKKSIPLINNNLINTNKTLSKIHNNNYTYIEFNTKSKINKKQQNIICHINKKK